MPRGKPKQGPRQYQPVKQGTLQWYSITRNFDKGRVMGPISQLEYIIDKYKLPFRETLQLLEKAALEAIDATYFRERDRILTERKASTNETN